MTRYDLAALAASERPHVTRLTAPGRGAIAVIRIWGPGAVGVADSVFRPDRGAPLAATRAGELRLGRIGTGLGDEVVAVVHADAETAVEFQCHGGAAAVELVLRELEAAGAQLCDPAMLGEGTQTDRLSAAARHDLSFAPTVRTAEILLDQAEGALEREIVRQIHRIEQTPARASTDLDALIGRGEIGRRLISGWRIVLAGRPNVGKSRLFNALAGFARAIVDPMPGTTRDVVSLRTAFSGWPVEIADTAGLRQTEDPVESVGVERSWREHRGCDLVVLVLDRSRPIDALDRELLELIERRVVVANKSDLPPAWLALEGAEFVTVSAERGDGVPDLIAALTAGLVPIPPIAGAAVPFRIDQLVGLARARERLIDADAPGAIRALWSVVHGAESGDVTRR
jgi:tRNA modification GTPase